MNEELLGYLSEGFEISYLYDKLNDSVVVRVTKNHKFADQRMIDMYIAQEPGNLNFIFPVVVRDCVEEIKNFEEKAKRIMKDD